MALALSRMALIFYLNCIFCVAKNADIISCPNDTIMTLNSSIRSHFVSYPEPIFHGRNGERLPTTCPVNRPANGSVFNLGVETVVCYTGNSDNPGSKCEFKVDIRGVLLHLFICMCKVISKMFEALRHLTTLNAVASLYDLVVYEKLCC